MLDSVTSFAPTCLWRLAPPPPESLIDALPDVHPVAVRVLASRGITDAASARAFLSCAPGDDDPDQIAGIRDAVARIGQAIGTGEQIVVYGDFDADGVTATALLVEVLEALGADVRPFIPHRQRDGYGVQGPALQRLAEGGARLIVTVDCGIRAAAEIAAAARGGLDFVITDHHVLPDQLPEVEAIVNPHRPDCRYTFKDLAAVGLAYKLAQALLREATLPRRGSNQLPSAESLLDLVALGTVADVVPLVGENRSLVRRGLEVLREARRPGIRALLDVARLEAEDVTARAVSFVLAPRLNAAGRMDDADAALDLLLAKDPATAWELARVLEDRNLARRTATEKALTVAEAHLAARTGQPLLFFADPTVELGVTGLVAGRLAERHGRPAAVARIDGGRARGSARSVPAFDIVAALEQVSDLLVRFGGHARAAGFTVPTDDLPRFEQRLTDLADRALAGQDLRQVLEIDAEVRLPDLGWPLFEALERLAPFGEGNPQPQLLVRDVSVADARVVGTNHLKFVVEGGPAVGSMDAIAFRQAERLAAVTAARRADLVCALRVNDWRGNRFLELQVVDLAAPDAG